VWITEEREAGNWSWEPPRRAKKKKQKKKVKETWAAKEEEEKKAAEVKAAKEKAARAEKKAMTSVENEIGCKWKGTDNAIKQDYYCSNIKMMETPEGDESGLRVAHDHRYCGYVEEKKNHDHMVGSYSVSRDTYTET
jgi:hypothetical protein